MNDRLDRQSPAGTKGRERAAAIAAGLLSFLCLFIYGVAAWFYRLDLDGDLAIVQLMVRDIVRGTAWPAFFYGQAYMGTLEPFANALTYLCLGRTPLALQAGTLLFTLLAVFFTARMAYRAGGWRGVSAALLLCTFAPVEFLRYSVSPRGGYGVLFLCTTALLDLGVSLTILAKDHETDRKGPFPSGRVFLLGLLAGIGFWCNQLVLPAVGAVGLTFLLLVPRLLSRFRFWVCGAAGFLLGSAPFWAWNLRHGMESFRMASSVTLDGIAILHHAGVLVLKRWPSLFNVHSLPLAWRIVLLLASLVPVALALPSLFGRTGRRPAHGAATVRSGKGIQRQVLFTYLVLFGLCFISSAFAFLNTPRYLFPTIFILAVLFADGCAEGRSRPVRTATLAALLLLAGWDARCLGARLRERTDYEQQYDRVRHVVGALRATDVKTAFTFFGFHSFNVIGNGGEIVFSDPLRERMDRFARALELDDSPAVIENYLGAATWARASGGSIDATRIHDLRVATNAVAPSLPVEEVPPARWRSVVDRRGRDLLAPLSDRSSRDPVHLAEDDALTISLKEPLPLCGLRLHAQAAPFLDGFTLYGRSTAETPYHPLTPLVPETLFAWSGPRFYYYRSPFPREARFAPERLESIQIRFDTNPDTPYGDLFDLQLLAPAAEAPLPATTYRDSLPALVALLRRQGVRRLYAGRWIANHVSSSTQGAIWTNWGDRPSPDAPPPSAILLDPFTAILSDKAGSPSLRDALSSHGFSMREIPIPPYGTLFLPGTNQRIPLAPPAYTGVAFRENYALTYPGYEWMRQLLDSLPEPVTGEELLGLHGSEPESVPLLQAIFSAVPDEGLFPGIRDELQALTRPTIGIGFPARFKGGPTWRGARILDEPPATAPSRPPRGIVLRNYWSSSPSVPRDRFDLVCTFLPSLPGGGRPLASHRFPMAEDVVDAIGEDGEVQWHTDSYLPYPDVAPGAACALSIALKGKEFPFPLARIRTDLPVRRHEMILPDVLFYSHGLSF